MNPRLWPIDLLATIAGGTSIVAWQEQLEWSLKIVAAVIAILAGLGSLFYHRRDRRRYRLPREKRKFRLPWAS